MPLERGKPPSRLDAPIQSLPPAQFLHLPEREFQRHRPSSRTKLPIERLAGDDDGIVAPDQSKTPNNGQATPATSGGAGAGWRPIASACPERCGVIMAAQ